MNAFQCLASADPVDGFIGCRGDGGEQRITLELTHRSIDCPGHRAEVTYKSFFGRWGYSTPSDRAWINGGSPTQGFLSNVAVGPFEETFKSMAGAWWADWVFMLGLLGIGIALILGVALRISAVAGTIMMLLMWAAEWPPDKTTSAGEPSMSTNPLIEYHIIYALVVIVLAATYAGHTWGLGRPWSRLVGSRALL
jgi:thiosulfate dehydrogenase (quinone) large subunit